MTDTPNPTDWNGSPPNGQGMYHWLVNRDHCRHVVAWFDLHDWTVFGKVQSKREIAAIYAYLAPCDPPDETAAREITRLTALVDQLRADNALLAGAVRVWEPVETARRDGTAAITYRNQSDIDTDWFDAKPGETHGWLKGTTHFQPLPDPPDPSRDAAVREAIGRATRA